MGENAYSRIVEEILKRDPNGGVVAFADMMRKQIVMPAHLMNDMKHEELNGGANLFADFSIVAEKTETYTAFDYADIMEHLVKRWEISSVTGLNADGLEARVRVQAACSHSQDCGEDGGSQGEGSKGK